MLETIYRIRDKTTGLYMHNRISWSESGVFIRSLEEAKNDAFWAELDTKNFEIIEYVLNEKTTHQIT